MQEPQVTGNDKQLGLTLIELMLVIALSGIVSTLIYQSLFTTLHIYQRGMDKLFIQNELRLILRYINKDLKLASQVRVYSQSPEKPAESANRSYSSQSQLPLTNEMKLVVADKNLLFKTEGEKLRPDDSGIIRYYLVPVSGKGFTLFRFRGNNKQLLSSRIDTMNISLLGPDGKSLVEETPDADKIKAIRLFLRLTGEDGRRKESYATTLLYGQ